MVSGDFTQQECMQSLSTAHKYVRIDDLDIR